MVGGYEPPAHYRVQALMDDFVNLVNRGWESADPVVLASYVLWRINYIHPFINGNGRTARATCYFVLCVKAGGWLPGSVILPQLLKRERTRYVKALRVADHLDADGSPDLDELHALISELLAEQLNIERR
jgi:Fic family protein